MMSAKGRKIEAGISIEGKGGRCNDHSSLEMKSRHGLRGRDYPKSKCLL